MTFHAENDDATLARLAQSGELSAFDELAKRYQTPLLRFIRARVLDSEAEDVCQETFVKAFRHLHQFRPSYAFKNWLFAIAYHVMIDGHRKSCGTVRPIDHAKTQNDPADPAEHAMAADRKRVLWAIAETVLTPEPYLALWLYYAEQMSSGEVAQVMNRSTVSVKVMLHRARKVLARHLDKASFIDAASPARRDKVGDV